MHQSYWVRKTLLPWSHPSPIALAIFPPPLLHSFLSPEERRGLMETAHFKLSIPKSLTLHITQLWMSVVVGRGTLLTFDGG